MSHPPNEILLVTPVWNDSVRLMVFGKELARVLAASLLPIRWIIADDGSTEDPPGRLVQLRGELSLTYPQVEVHFAMAHRGKGAVIREAWALGPEAGWLAFVDADGSVGAFEMLDLIVQAVEADRSVVAVRKHTARTQVIETPWRGLMHRGFLISARLLLDLHCGDTQCGAKVLRANDYRKIAPHLDETGWAFDAELLCALDRAGSRWIETPVSWVEKKGGKVKPLRDACVMLVALLRIRRKWQKALLPKIS